MIKRLKKFLSRSTPPDTPLLDDPHVVTVGDHAVNAKRISSGCRKVVEQLDSAGYAAYAVGGCVRDLLLGLDPKDFDVATDATPEEVCRIFRRARIIGRRFQIVHVRMGREIIEVTTFRGHHNGDDGDDSHQSEAGMLLRDNRFGTISEDAHRRDFTVNALYYHPQDGTIFDFSTGLQDIEARQLRIIGHPETRYREDPVRMLRAARLAAKLDFQIEAATAEPIPRLAPLLREAAPARLFEECLKLFLSGHAVASFQALETHGLLDVLLPESAAAMSANRSGALRKMVIEGLRGTDARVAADEPVSPAFLFALLLWPAYCRQLMALQAQGVHTVEAQRRAADRVMLHQLSIVALPRRFSVPMQEIWLLQSRFGLRQRKRVMRMLSHPRFRAAFDFLQVRQAGSDEHADDIAFWREAQLDPDLAIAHSAPEDAGEDPAPRRRRRRRPASPSVG